MDFEKNIENSSSLKNNSLKDSYDCVLKTCCKKYKKKDKKHCKSCPKK